MSDTQYLRDIAKNENLPSYMRQQMAAAADEIERLLAAAPAVQGEPVAYTLEDDIYFEGGGEINDYIRSNGQPLYAAPQPAPVAITAGMLEAIWRDGFDAENYDDQAYCQPLIIARIAVEEAQPAPDVSALVEALEAAQKEALRGINHARNGAQAAAALGRVSAIVGAALDAHRKGDN